MTRSITVRELRRVHPVPDSGRACDLNLCVGRAARAGSLFVNFPVSRTHSNADVSPPPQPHGNEPKLGLAVFFVIFSS